jgi:hypothetical protein
MGGGVRWEGVRGFAGRLNDAALVLCAHATKLNYNVLACHG